MKNKNLILGIILGLGAFLLYDNLGKREPKLKERKADKYICEKKVIDDLKSMMFINSEAKENYKKKALKACLESK